MLPRLMLSLIYPYSAPLDGDPPHQHSTASVGGQRNRHLTTDNRQQTPSAPPQSHAADVPAGARCNTLSIVQRTGHLSVPGTAEQRRLWSRVSICVSTAAVGGFSGAGPRTLSLRFPKATQMQQLPEIWPTWVPGCSAIYCLASAQPQARRSSL